VLHALAVAAIFAVLAAILFAAWPGLDEPHNDPKPGREARPEPLGDLEPRERTEDEGPEPPSPAMTLAA
jgi:hypothetical protein